MRLVSSRLVSSRLAITSCLDVASCLVVTSLLVVASHRVASCRVASRRAHFIRLVVMSSCCILTLHPIVTFTFACRCCIESCCCNASRPVALFHCRVLFIWLSRYLSQRVDLHPHRRTLMLTPLFLMFCRRSCRRGPTPSLPSAVAQRALEHAARARPVPKCQVWYFPNLEGGNSTPEESYSGESNRTLEYFYSYYFDCSKFLPRTPKLKKIYWDR